ncbi:uncharacterized protein PITG_09108 [Phytophthora infestans T30-4]|uniref:Uncharacterized protein n=1 Tax=Phytophthora infestans (strain T30-4) TaxID=403677 RepID=D0NBQ4_PHYIT|nr:uncharacterized protein PITG_09108 [Phytophthora infestans T30-4]EEY55209.1 hypothetical protein PITG_09108 [Phytophthora infestans T30-4]|eukprot:XP_002903433.1 hypothetical protein PITG_09108 [Phytophthora infestans T30-4]
MMSAITGGIFVPRDGAASADVAVAPPRLSNSGDCTFEAQFVYATRIKRSLCLGALCGVEFTIAFATLIRISTQLVVRLTLFFTKQLTTCFLAHTCLLSRAPEDNALVQEQFSQ